MIALISSSVRVSCGTMRRQAPTDPPKDERAEAERKVEHIFMELLMRLTLEGRMVNDRSGPANAPSVFSKEREAKTGKVGKSALADAMRRLFEKGKIKVESYQRGGHDAFKIVAV